MSPGLAGVVIAAYMIGSTVFAYLLPQSVLAFLAVEASLLVIYYLPAPQQVKRFCTVVLLCGIVPALGLLNGYYLEIAIQIGIFIL